MFEKINKYYKMGLYTDKQVMMFVTKGVISESQYREIIGLNDVAED